MTDPTFHLSQTNDRNFKDPFRRSGSRQSQINDKNTFSDQEFVQFRPNSQAQLNAAESDDSGVCSPPLWKSSQSPSSEPLLSHHVYRSLSPASRLQAITRGQKELMEMVKNMPESSYELSLKDLVEYNRTEVEAAAAAPPPPPQLRVKRQESKKMVRNGSFEMENKGLFLNMVFPFTLQSKKMRNLDRSFSGRVSLKTPETVKGGGGGGEVEWWRKRFGGSSGSDSSRISNSGGGSSRSSSGGSSSGRSYSGGRKGDGLARGCWPFLRSKNGKSDE